MKISAEAIDAIQAIADARGREAYRAGQEDMRKRAADLLEQLAAIQRRKTAEPKIIEF